jgi:hypothetical protein
MKSKVYEDSKADKREDAAGAKRAGVSAKKYETSAAEKRADSAGQKRLTPRGKGR